MKLADKSYKVVLSARYLQTVDMNWSILVGLNTEKAK